MKTLATTYTIEDTGTPVPTTTAPTESGSPLATLIAIGLIIGIICGVVVALLIKK